MSVPYLNRQLFSDHWLRERLPLREEYALTPLALANVALWSRRLPALGAAANAWDARETLERVVAPGLALLGYADGEWLALRVTLWPHDADLLWRQGVVTATAAEAAEAPAGSSPAPQVLVGVASWATDLDTAPQDGAQKAQTSALLFLRLLAKAEAAWGVLTNGRQWRLYSRDAETLEAAYEVDLPALAALGDVDALNYFYLFFAAAAQVAPAQGEPSFLQVALRESREYAARIEDDLRVRAFEAIQAACQALADALAGERGMSAAFLTHEELTEVYQDALALLYRLLFVLYAESRELLPTRDPVYAADYGLREVIANLPARPDARLDADAMSATSAIWPRLARLFRALNDEEHSTVVPAFSGRLFNDELHPLLARLTLADAPVARMLILLGRTRDGRQIDYADLSVRQLGGIYEGLLEHQAIAVAIEEMALAKGPKDKSALVVRRAEVGDRRILETYPVGAVYLSNDRGERHAAGTYYTPEPVVRYLVEETLGPLVAGKSAERILALRVLDPAMGSAHFLVAAVDYLTRAALAAQEGASPTTRLAKAARNAADADEAIGERGERDVLALKRRVAEQCVYGVDVNAAAVELGKLSLWLATAAKDRPLTFLDLHLRVGNSLMGLAPGELEATIQRPPPGAGKRRAARTSASAPAPATSPTATASATLWGDLWNETAYTQAMFKVVGAAHVVDLMPTDTVAAARSKQHVTGEIEREMRRYREAADLAVSLRLGNTVAPEEYRAALQTLLDQGGFRLGAATLGSALQQARQLRDQHAIFHWELEFPEVFRDGNGQPLGANAGFDAILGNPPYVSVTTLRASDPVAWAYYPQVFQTTTRGQYDLYVAFVERALALLNARGRLAYILPNKWLTTDFGAPLRDLLATRRAVRALVDFGSYQVFPGVSNYTCLLFAGAARIESVAVTKRTTPEGEIELPPTPASRQWARGAVAAHNLNDKPWDLTVGDAQTVLAKWQNWPTLGEAANIFLGTGTRADPVFIVYELAREADGVVVCFAPALGRAVRLEAALLHPVLQGRDIQPYSFDGHGARLLSPYRLADGKATLLTSGDLQARYPLTWAYLNDPTVRGVLLARESGRFMERDDWYGFGYPRNMSLLPEPKLVLPDVAARGRVAWDATGHDIVDTAYGITLRPASAYASGFLLAALNSPILTFFLRHRGTDLRGGYFRMKTAYLNPFPLPPIGDAAGGASAGEHAAQAIRVGERALAVIRADQPPTVIAATLGRLPGATLHDVVAALAEHVTELASGEQQAWRRFTEVALGLRPPLATAPWLRDDDRLRFERAHEMESPDALIAMFAKHDAPLTAPELSAIHAAHRQARQTLLDNRRERTAVAALTDHLLYTMYELNEDEIAIVEGRVGATDTGDSAGGAARTDGLQEDAGGVSYENRRKQRKVAGRGKTDSRQEAQNVMSEVTGGGKPNLITRCVAQSLANPYSGESQFNVAMDYAPTSAVGPHYMNTAVLAGLLTETHEGWLRPTPAGRHLLLAALTNSRAVWDALLALPAYRCYLEYNVALPIQRNLARTVSEVREVEAAVLAAFPAFRSRAVSLQETLRLDALPTGRPVAGLRNPPSLEPIGWKALDAWAKAQGLGSNYTNLSRATEIGETLARAALLPLCVRSEWLEPAQLLALTLLIAARHYNQGILLPTGGAPALEWAVEALCQSGLDIRMERRGAARVATLVPAITLRIATGDSFDEATSGLREPERSMARVVSAALREVMRVGPDGAARGELAPAELATRCADALASGTGAFASAAAADEAPPVDSAILVGPPAPLATDVVRLGRAYRFFDDAIQAQARGGQGGVAALLSDWLTQQRQAPPTALATNPHLALLYLLAADGGDRAERLARRDDGWFYAGTPVVPALDDRLRALGYDVWDEGYRADAQRVAALGAALVEQGLAVGALTVSDDPASPLEAPTSYGYYQALDLLTVEPARRTAR